MFVSFKLGNDIAHMISADTDASQFVKGGIDGVDYPGNMFDPAYTMVCKMSKAVLEQMGAKRR